MGKLTDESTMTTNVTTMKLNKKLYIFYILNHAASDAMSTVFIFIKKQHKT